MTRIEITAAAYAALCAAVLENRPLPAMASAAGGFYLWIDNLTLDRLMTFRAGEEDHSDTIIRLAREDHPAASSVDELLRDLNKYN
jgi:hypothetical protein